MKEMGMLPIISAILLLSSSSAKAVSIGVNYGANGDNLPTPDSVATFLATKTSIDRVKLFDANPAFLSAFAANAPSISLSVSLPNSVLPSLADPSTGLAAARGWVRDNLVPSAANVTLLLAGNEILGPVIDPNLMVSLLPAMRRLDQALKLEGLPHVRVTTPHYLGILAPSDGIPSNATFKPELTSKVLTPMLKFLNDTGSPLMVNAYPYFSYTARTLNYAVFRPNAGIYDPATRLNYTSMLDAQIDAVYTAMKKLVATAPLLPARSLLVPPQQSGTRPPASLRACLSRYSEPSSDPKRRRDPIPSHPAFSPAARRRAKKISIPETGEPAAGIRVTDRGLAYQLDGAPFEFQYSYTEAPRARPVALREAPYLPFGPEATPRPWTGRKPLPKSRKEMPEFDSFVLPPPGKKGVKPVQSPGPFLAGMEPRYQAASREEVLGEPLTKEEIADLVNGSLKTKRLLNIGRDGLTHNMLENIHAHWKRKRVCKIRCKGVCTVDMDNVCQQLEEKVGGKVIHRQGGVIFLFRGRNYNYRTRPCFPLMLWKPVAPVYPRLVKKVPDGLTPEQVTEMRKRGRDIPPICKLGKNGVYVNLVKQVREAFEVCDLVRVDCSDLNKSDCRKIGAKLKDLVPCVLISFEFEHILMWRGNDWKSSLPLVKENNFEVTKTQEHFSDKELKENVRLTQIELTANEVITCNSGEDGGEPKDFIKPSAASDISSSSAMEAQTVLECSPSNPGSDFVHPSLESALHSQTVLSAKSEDRGLVDESFNHSASSGHCPDALEPYLGVTSTDDELEATRKDAKVSGSDILNSDAKVPSYMEGVVLLLKQAIGNGSAVVLNENEFVDYNLVYQKSVALAKSAPRGPVFHGTRRRSNARRNGPDKDVRNKKHLAGQKVPSHVEKKDKDNGGLAILTNDHAQEFLSDIVPQGTLRLDELAKLLA